MALARADLASAESDLSDLLCELKTRVPAVQMWNSITNHAEFTLAPYIEFAAGPKMAAERTAAESLLQVFKELAAK